MYCIMKYYINEIFVMSLDFLPKFLENFNLKKKNGNNILGLITL